ncbi:MAG: phosphoribosylaminoimidazolesuccinocarboxamide synthase [Chloroflexi bacterium]|nr:MAG: phosphoribosylaminoimidazolesuccinocarboxamide synthase [Chloroflexota bacterium]
MEARTWRIGELAVATGLTTRALRHYEHEGLLAPSSRTEAGHRVYSSADVARLYEVLVLRRIGLGLAAIREQLESPRDLRDVVAKHLAQTRATIATQQRLAERLQRVGASLENGQPSSESLLRVMEDMVALLTTDRPDLISRGKVRDMYALPDNRVLMVATDRMSAFDVVMPNGIPRKGEVLTRLSSYWFDRTAAVVPNHMIEALDASNAAKYGIDDETLFGRSMVVHRAEPLPVECVVRGYLAGSAWADYKAGRLVSGVKLPEGLQQCDRLFEPIFTPSTKAEAGHDEPISYEEVVKLVGEERANVMKLRALALYRYAADIALERGIIIADTKFEFGMLNGEVTLIDECLTPDSSRFWPLDQYQVGRDQPSFDKQPLRDWLEASGWNKQPPGPMLPDDVVASTSERYLEAFRRVTGTPLPD